MTYIAAKYVTADQQYIDLTDDTGREITISMADPETQMLFAQAMQGMFGPIGPYVAPVPSKARLQQYANDKANLALLTTRMLSVGSLPTKQVKSDASDATLNSVWRLSEWGATHPGSSRVWVQNDMSVVTLTGQEFVDLYTLLLAFEQEAFSALADALAAIDSGAITTFEQLDGFGWPS